MFLTFFLTVFAFISFVAYIYKCFKERPKNFPPGPPRLPLWGSYWFMLKENYNHPHHAFSKLGKHYATDILGLYLGDTPTVVTLSHKLCKELLTREEFIGRNDTIVTRTRALGKRIGLFFVDGPFWKEQRRFTLRHMRDYGFGRRSQPMEERMYQEIKYLINLFTDSQTHEKDICRKQGEILFPDALYGPLLNAIFLTLASTSFENRLQLREFARAGLRVQRSGDTTGCAISMTPWLKYISPDFFGYTTVVDNNDSMLHFLRGVIAHHKETYIHGHNRDFIDEYLQELHDLNESESSFSDDQLLLALLDTTFPAAIACGHTMHFYFALLLNHQDVQKKIQSEIDEVVGGARLPSLDDRKFMPYTEASIRESIRVAPINPLAIARRCVQDCELAGYFIPKNTIMLPCVSSAHMDESIWEEPEKFKPERWLNELGELKKRDDTLGFGGGKRLCMGETFSRQNMFLLVTGLLQNFTLTVPDGHPLPNVDDQIPGVNVSLADYWIKAIPR